MLRTAIQLVLAMGVVTALAVFDFGPRANAGYLSMTSKHESVGTAVAHDETSKNPCLVERSPLPSLQFLGGGGMSTTNTNPLSGSSAAAAFIPQVELPVDSLVVYFREAAASLRLSAFIDSLLDPPRFA